MLRLNQMQRTSSEPHLPVSKSNKNAENSGVLAVTQRKKTLSKCALQFYLKEQLTQK